MNIYQQFLSKKHKVRDVEDFRQLVYGSAEKYGSLPAFILRGRTISYKTFKDDYRGLCTALIQRGYQGSRIAVIGENSYGWILAYLAASSIGVAVPIDKELSAEDMDIFIEAAECSVVFADEKYIESVSSDKVKEKFILGVSSSAYERTVFDLALDGVMQYASGKRDFDTFTINPEEMHILIFTSGTTGNAKGVCLSQKNICSNIKAIASMVKVDPSRHSLSVLPLHHTYESTIGHLLLLSSGGAISYCDGLKYVAKNLTEFQPSVIIAVPLLLEFMLRTIDKSIRKSLPDKYTKDADLPLNELLKTLPFVLRMVVKKKVQKSLGGKLKLLIVGAAAVKPETIRAFEMLGITTYQGYGLTECSPLLAGNNDFFRNAEAVGLPIHGVELRIEEPDDEGVGEIVAKGDNIMLGYYNDPEATAEVMRGGYFHTGDLGRFEEHGFLYTTGRCKNVIVTRNGKNIYPEELETRLTDEEIIEEAIVIGVPSSKKDDIVAKAKIFPNFDGLKELHGGEMPSNDAVSRDIKNIVEKINDKLPNYKRITAVEVVWEAFEKTTTKKIKRFGQNIL